MVVSEVEVGFVGCVRFVFLVRFILDNFFF